MRRHRAEQGAPDVKVAIYSVLFAPDGSVAVSAKWAPGAAFPTRFVLSIGPCSLAAWVGHKLAGQPSRQSYFNELGTMSTALVDQGSTEAISEKLVGGHVSDVTEELIASHAEGLLASVFQRSDGAMYADWQTTQGFSVAKLGMASVAAVWAWARSQTGADQRVIDVSLALFSAFHAQRLDNGAGLATRAEYLQDGMDWVIAAYDMVKTNPAWPREGSR
jgi:hypothetical protein